MIGSVFQVTSNTVATLVMMLGAFFLSGLTRWMNLRLIHFPLSTDRYTQNTQTSLQGRSGRRVPQRHPFGNLKLI